MEELFHENREESSETDAIGPKITNDEVKIPIKKLKINKTAGPDGIGGEVIKLIEEEEQIVITELFKYMTQGTYLKSGLPQFVYH